MKNGTIDRIADKQIIWVAQSEKFIGTNEMSGIELYDFVSYADVRVMQN